MLTALSRRAWSALQQLVLPWTCVSCGATTQAKQGDLCPACAAAWPPLACCCPRCAQPLLHAAPACGRCLQRPPAFESAWSPWRYRAPLDALIQGFKLSGRLAIGRVLAEQFCVRWQHSGRPRPDLIVPVPLHPQRLRERGFDQALELARVMSDRLQIPLAAHGLQRIRSTATQTGLKRKARRANVYRAFAAGVLPARPGHVVLVDDVLTTGATANACARVLRRCGAERIEVWALARAGRGAPVTPAPD